MIAVSLLQCAHLALVGWVWTHKKMLRYPLTSRAPEMCIAMNLVIAGFTFLGCQNDKLWPWLVLSMVKLFDLIAQAAYGAIGHHHIFIVTLVITHWGVFVMLAYLIYMQTELEE